MLSPLTGRSTYVHVGALVRADNEGITNFTPQASLTDDREASRSMVQKSIVALCTKPIYGAIQLVLESYTRAYFAMGLFDDVSLLESFYTAINTRLCPGTINQQNRDVLLFQGALPPFSTNSL